MPPSRKRCMRVTWSAVPIHPQFFLFFFCLESDYCAPCTELYTALSICMAARVLFDHPRFLGCNLRSTDANRIMIMIRFLMRRATDKLNGLPLVGATGLKGRSPHFRVDLTGKLS